MSDRKACVLPVTYPPITTLPGYADALTVLYNYENTYNWVYSHYIQLFAIDKLNRVKNDVLPWAGGCFFDFDSRRLATIASDFNFFKRDYGCPFFYTYEMGSELLLSFGGSFESIVKHCIDLSMYVYTYLDVSQIKEYNMSSKFSHTVLIYGYNDSEQLFYFADFANSPMLKYNFSTCSYAEINNAFMSVNTMDIPGWKSVAAIQYRDYMSYELDFSYIKDTIKEYLYPCKTATERFNKFILSALGPFSWKTEVYLGTDFYTYLGKFIDDELGLGSDSIDHRFFHGLYDHKEMMIKRIEYLIKKGYLEQAKAGLLQKYELVKMNAKNIRNTILKFNISKQYNLLKAVQAKLDETKDLEVELLKEIFEIQ